jgi:hypothetical protein
MAGLRVITMARPHSLTKLDREGTKRSRGRSCGENIELFEGLVAV